MISRRNFLRTTSGALATAGALHPLLSWATNDQNPEIPGEDRMIVRSSRFLDLEMPPEFAASWITPVNHFYVRNHMLEPASFDVGDWRINVDGEVDNSASLTIADLQKFEQHSVVNTLECAGNGRSF